jgi:hypothetical protein
LNKTFYKSDSEILFCYITLFNYRIISHFNFSSFSEINTHQKLNMSERIGQGEGGRGNACVRGGHFDFDAWWAMTQENERRADAMGIENLN